MYLKSIELSGFKSFGKKTELQFGSRIAGIVGPNGSGKCVSPETRVQLADGRRMLIKELFDMACVSPKRIRHYDDGVAVFAEHDTPEVVSMDVLTGKLVPRPIAAFIRRTAPPEMLTITTRSGKTITATPYHPLFTLRDGVIATLRADEVVSGVRIAAPRLIAIQSNPYHFSMRSVLAAFKDGDNVFLPYSAAMVAEAVGRNPRSATRLARTRNTSSESVQSWFEGQSLGAGTATSLFAEGDEKRLFKDRILKSKTTGTMRVPETLDEPMARFLGYLIAEGRNCKNGQIRFVNDDMPLVEDFISCARTSFDVAATMRSYKGRGIQDVFISSITLSRFLDRVLGITQDGHSRHKSVPPQLFASSENVIAAFLSALFEGDSYIHCATPKSRGAYVEYATASEQLARDVAALLLRFGVTAQIKSKQKRATNSPNPVIRTYWSIFVSGSENIEKLPRALTFRGRKKEALSKLYRSEASANPNVDLVPSVCGLVRITAQKAGVSIKKARKEYPTLAAYYEGRCEASRPGLLRSIEGIKKYGTKVTSANQHLQRLRELAETDVLWDEVVTVERKKGEGFVYDLSVLDYHNFVAGEVIAHNSNVADGFRFVLGEQSMKSMRGKRGEDMIWGGSPALPRMNRAAVRLVFDNSKKLLDIDFSEVVVERIVHRDGANEYLLNGSQVRLKDVIRLLAGANIGGSGYQIISQGEADRILNASPKERREMVEDALGLKLYQHKKAESERKLEETAVNIDKTKSLRRELAPHLKFLEAQVEKIEKAREMKAELAHKLTDYLARENAWLSAEATRIADDVHERETEIHALQSKLHGARSVKGGVQKESPLLTKVQALQNEVGEARRRRELIVRDLGRAEGAVEAAAITVEHVVPAPHVRDFVREITEAIEEAEHVLDIVGVKKLLSQLRERIRAFIEGLSGAAPITNEEARKEVIRLAAALEKAEAEESRIAKALEEARGEIAREREAAFAAEREEVQFEAQLREVQSKMFALKSEREHLGEQKLRFEEEVREGIALLGSAFEGWNNHEVPEGALVEERREQEKRRRDIERYKIKIEEAGVGGGEAIEKEYQQTTERDAFLAKELEDLEHSAASLKDLIAELEKTIDARFKDGLKHINEALGGFFEKLFGGGHAKLFVEEKKSRRRLVLDGGLEYEENEDVNDDGEEELYAGLSIDVALPRKKIRGLEVLSGGERALTSIALIFSMSQVNPPPFLILDETDAALDEANSKRYADMIMELGKKSQLIVITHNRATMSAAGELYGVTMSQDGVSKILSVKLEEAERVAK